MTIQPGNFVRWYSVPLMTSKTFLNKLIKSCFCICIVICLPFLGSSQLTFTGSDEGVEIKEAGNNVLFYQKKIKTADGAFPRNNYIHPLYNLDGTILTEDFPEDHPHHRGIFWAWHQIFIGTKPLGDSWDCRDIYWNIIDTNVYRDGEILILISTTHWESKHWLTKEGTKKPFLLENTTIRIHPKEHNYRMINFEISLLALEENLSIGGSDDEKGYGGFSARMKLPKNVQFFSSNGIVSPKINAVQGGNWMKISGSSNGIKNDSGMVIISHQSSPGSKQNWILRDKESMQNCVYPGRKPVPVSTTDPTILKYSLLIYEGNLTGQEIQSIYEKLN